MNIFQNQNHLVKFCSEDFHFHVCVYFFTWIIFFPYMIYSFLSNGATEVVRWRFCQILVQLFIDQIPIL
jgi:hypothetical protein